MDPKQKKIHISLAIDSDRFRLLLHTRSVNSSDNDRRRTLRLHTIISHNCILSSSGIFCITITCHIASTKRKIGNGLIVPRLCKLRYRNLRNCVHIQGIILNVLKYDFFFNRTHYCTFNSN